MTSLHDLGAFGPLGPEQHGTRKSYAAGCRCVPCRSAESCYQAMRAQARARGDTAWIDAGPSRAHVAMLRAHGLGVRQIAALAGISARTVWSLHHGRPRITKGVEARILQVKPIPAGGIYVNGYKAYDYIRLLLNEGYSEAQLRQWLKMERGSLRRQSKRVRLALERRARDLYQWLTAE